MPETSTREVFSYLQNIKENQNYSDQYEFKETINDDSNLFRIQTVEENELPCYIPYLEVLNKSSEINHKKLTCEFTPECSRLDNNQVIFSQNEETVEIQNITSVPISLKSQHYDKDDNNKRLNNDDNLSKYTPINTDGEKSKSTDTDPKEKINILDHIIVPAPFTYKPVSNVDMLADDESLGQISDDSRDADYNPLSDSSSSSSSKVSVNKNILCHVKEDVYKAESHSTETSSVIIQNDTPTLEDKQTADHPGFSISRPDKKQVRKMFKSKQL